MQLSIILSSTEQKKEENSRGCQAIFSAVLRKGFKNQSDVNTILRTIF